MCLNVTWESHDNVKISDEYGTYYRVWHSDEDQQWHILKFAGDSPIPVHSSKCQSADDAINTVKELHHATKDELARAVSDINC